MREKAIKQIKTSCPFPLLIYKTSVTYNEVRKASGIAYILLDLIQKFSTSTELISRILLQFGIPKELHFMFGEEIARLMKADIVSSVYTADKFLEPKYFSQIGISDVKLTEKGKEMFKEGAIPTGEEKVKVKDIYFSPVTRKYDTVSSVPYMAMRDCFLGEEFLDTVDIDNSGMEDYLHSNLTKIGLKAEERIVSFETEEPQRKVTRRDEGMTICIYPTCVGFSYETTDEQVFFDRYYSSALMTEMMLLKNSYKFVNEMKELIPVSTVRLTDLGEIANIYIPADTQKQVSRPCKLFLNRGRLDVQRKDNVLSPDKSLSGALLEHLNKNAEFALCDNGGLKYYLAVNVEMPCENFDDNFEMQLLIEKLASEEEVEQTAEMLFGIEYDAPFEEENAKIVLFVADIFKNVEHLEKYTLRKLSEVNTVDEKVALLLEIHAVFRKNQDWKEAFLAIAEKIFELSVAEVALDNMIYKKSVLSPLKDAMGLSNPNFISKFSANVLETEDVDLVFQALETAGFAINDILSVVNVVEPYMQSVLDNAPISGDTAFGNKFSVLSVNLWKLNGMLGVESYADYTLKEDYNVNEFFNVYSTLTAAYKDVEKYKNYAAKRYEVFGRYLTIFNPIHEILSIERTAASTPDKITKSYIDEHISRGRYKNAVCDLGVKLQYDLRNLLNDQVATADVLINTGREKGIIAKEAFGELHALRKCRNGFLHPEREQIPFDRERIEGWRDFVFALTEVKE